ncbi:hypothetical protein LR68_03063 [Anoxybacillus sp. BCO1]|nr:hypothetical protein LR68_03063 [Anoxybacillus sp. BCO1]
MMIHLNWHERPTIKTVVCNHTNAEKYIVHNVLTPGREYEVKNETDDFYFIIDNRGKVGDIISIILQKKRCNAAFFIFYTTFSNKFHNCVLY